MLMTEDSSSHWPIKRRYVYSETSRRAGLEFVCVFGQDGRLEEVVAFRDDLQRKRVARLTQERRQLSQEQSTVLRKIDAVSAELDLKLSYLSEHRALDEYLAVSKQLAEVQERIAKLEESRALRERVDREQRRIKREFAECSIPSCAKTRPF